MEQRCQREEFQRKLVSTSKQYIWGLRRSMKPPQAHAYLQSNQAQTDSAQPVLMLDLKNCYSVDSLHSRKLQTYCHRSPPELNWQSLANQVLSDRPHQPDRLPHSCTDSCPRPQKAPGPCSATCRPRHHTPAPRSGRDPCSRRKAHRRIQKAEIRGSCP